MLRQATALLNGDGLQPDEADEGRTWQLAGFRWILVDECQNIGPDEHDLISALADLTLANADDKLSLFAEGDDDRTIYGYILIVECLSSPAVQTVDDWIAVSQRWLRRGDFADAVPAGRGTFAHMHRGPGVPAARASSRG